MASKAPQILAVHHIVHEYANFVSSAEMTIHGKDVDGELITPPLNTHVSHVFYLNCRKLADFFQNKSTVPPDDIVAMHFVSGYVAKLPINDEWRKPINKQLAHLSYSRDTDAKEIKKKEQEALYAELKKTWQQFRRQLPPVFADEFIKEVKLKKLNSEFKGYDLD
jgi:hypothetical protein